jgi:hypothetical protein
LIWIIELRHGNLGRKGESNPVAADDEPVGSANTHQSLESAMHFFIFLFLLALHWQSGLLGRDLPV